MNVKYLPATAIPEIASALHSMKVQPIKFKQNMNRSPQRFAHDAADSASIVITNKQRAAAQPWLVEHDMTVYQEHAPRNATLDSTSADQDALYRELETYNLTPELVTGCDYFLIDTINGIEFYAPNDEEWGAIIAVSHRDGLANYTGFYEMDDMAAPDSDYMMQVHDGLMGCKFTFESYA